MQITSSSFKNGSQIPPKYTCDGEDVNPHLEFSAVPIETKSLALIVDDPDAPMGDWVHWLVYNLPPSQDRIEEDTIPINATFGQTDFGNKQWGGPCPPSGEHRYFFRLFALDLKPILPDGLNKKALIEIIRGHILDKAELIGTYQKT
jgi:Raf kinase inhibitor-like YbhB/YbcL family protein